MFLTLTLNPAIDCSVTVTEELALGRVHKARHETRTPGGKGINVAKILASNGRPVLAGGILGRDQAGFFGEFLAGSGIGNAFMLVEHPTRANLMIADDRRHELKVNYDGFPELDLDWPALQAYLLKAATTAEVVILSGSLPKRFPQDTYRRMIDLLHSMHKSVVVDSSGKALAEAVTAQPEVIKPNRVELAELTGRSLDDDGELVREMKQLARLHEVVIVSDGTRGAFFTTSGLLLRASAPTVKAADTTGAGDSLLGQFCADYFPTRELNESIAARAVAAGSAAVELRGTPVVPVARIAELAEEVQVTRLT